MTFHSGKLNGRYDLEDPGVVGIIKMKGILKKYCVSVLSGIIWHMIRTRVGSLRTRFYEGCGISWPDEWIFAASEELSFMESFRTYKIKS